MASAILPPVVDPTEITSPVLVIVPAHNEAEALPGVLEALRRSSSITDLHIVVVDDGSTDATADVARTAGVLVLSLPYNLGIGGALRTGFRYAIEHGYERAVQLDADGQHDPDLIPDLLAHLDGADLVIGSRFAPGADGYEVGRTRRKAMHLLEFLIRVLTGQSFTDTSSGFRAFNRPVLEYFARHYPSDYMESVEALLAASYEGFKIVEVPVHMSPRADGTPSNVRLKLAYHFIRVLLSLLTNASRRRPAPTAPRPDRA